MSSPPLDAVIPARSRRQAMDWSLVLASQGIEHRMDHDEAVGWTLAVSLSNHATAEDAIRLYRQENRHWRLRRQVFSPDLFFDWSSLVWVVLVIFFYGWSEARSDLRNIGMTSGAAPGEWWRWFTATWLHADSAHLASNIVFGFLFLGLVMGRYGPGLGLLAAYLAGVGGNVLAGWVHDATARGLGGSGVVMGALGLLTFPSFPFMKQRGSNAFRLVAGGMMGGLLLFGFVGVSPESDVVAHLGGFSTGWLLGIPLAHTPRFIHRPKINLAAGILFTGFVIFPWWRALMQSGPAHDFVFLSGG
jgi:membrane associated rhomboid family serine protease